MKLSHAPAPVAFTLGFKEIGDKYEGLFVRFIKDVTGTFGKEQRLVLDQEGTEVTIRCPAGLTRDISENPDKFVPGAFLRLSYDSQVMKGQYAAKVIEVDITPPGGDPVSDEDCPF